MKMNFRRVAQRDYPGILALQEANQFDNLTPEQRRDGFLMARFSAEQLAQMNRDAAIVIAEDGGRLVGYACCAGVEFSRSFPILAAMIATFRRTTYLGNAIADTRACIYGPVCVDRAYRGRGVFRGLIGKVKEELAGQYDVAAAFIAKTNARSLAAHVDGLGMTVVGDFEHNDGTYWTVCFGIPAADLACGVGPRR
jgi:L-amino acid N-acyltransferase YncA